MPSATGRGPTSRARRAWPSSYARARRSGCCAGSCSGWACTPTTRAGTAGGSWSPRAGHRDQPRPARRRYAHGRLRLRADGALLRVRGRRHGVDVASPLGGRIPVDPLSLKPVLRTEADDRYLGDDVLHSKLEESLAVGDLEMSDYDVVYLAGGWGAAFDLGVSEPLAAQMAARPRPTWSWAGSATAPRAAQRDRPGRPSARRGPAAQRGHRQAGPRAQGSPRRPCTRDRAPGQGGALRVDQPVPRPVRQPLGGRRQPGDQAEPERRADGGARDGAAHAGARLRGGRLGAGLLRGGRVTDWRELSARASFASHRLIGWIYWDPVAVEGCAELGLDVPGAYYITSRCARSRPPGTRPSRPRTTRSAPPSSSSRWRWPSSGRRTPRSRPSATARSSPACTTTCRRSATGWPRSRTRCGRRPTRCRCRAGCSSPRTVSSRGPTTRSCPRGSRSTASASGAATRTSRSSRPRT